MHYYELFGGSAKLFFGKKPASWSLISDIDESVYQWYQEVSKTRPDVLCTKRSAIEILTCGDFRFDENSFVYLDPPYPFLSRRAGKKYYSHEMSDDDHVQLLKAVLQCKGNVMISTRQNDLYGTMLADWRCKKFDTVDRAGSVQELIYMNYPEPTLLHQYDFVGMGFSDRQRIKRKVQRFQDKINELPGYEKHLLIQEMIKNDYAAVRHFMTTQRQANNS